MKKILLSVFIVASLALNCTAQRISSFSLYDNTTSSTLVPLVPFASFTPTNNSTTTPGDGQIVYLNTVNLTNANATIGCGTTASVVAPLPLPTDWSTTVSNIKIQDDGTVDTNWSLYNIVAKKITPASLPLTINTGTNFNSANWTSESCPGWAAVCSDKTTTTYFKLGSAGRSLVLAFTNNPDTLKYTLNYSSGTWQGSTNVFDVDGSVDGVSWTSIHRFDGTNYLNSTGTVYTERINKSYRFVRFFFTTRNTCNAIVQTIYVSKNQDQTTEVLSHKALNVQLYPNPVGEMLNISVDEDISEVKLYSNLGQLVLSSINNKQINVSQLPKGVYVASIKTAGSKTTSVRFVK